MRRRAAAVALLLLPVLGVAEDVAVVGVAVPAGARADLGPLDARHGVRPASTAVDKLGGDLEGKVVVIDPGHQLGNHHFPRRIRRPVPAGGFTKPCNTTGTATNGGYPEATFAWQVSRLVSGAAARARRDGAPDPAEQPAGPLGAVRRRTRPGRQRHALTPGRRPQAVDPRRRVVRRRRARLPRHRPARPGAVDRRHPPAVEAAGDLGEGRPAVPALRRGDLHAGGDGIDVRADLATLNLSDVPTVMVELGNMRSPTEARVMTSPSGRARYARGLVSGVRRFLG